jgi:transcription elongation factor Elf1
VRASFTREADEEPAITPLESCATCHATDTTTRPAPAEWIEDKELDTPGKIEPVPTAGTFKLSPTGHASCFICHFQEQQPVATNCAGCHGLATKSSSAKNAKAHLSQPQGLNAGGRGVVPSQSKVLKVKSAHTPDVWLERISSKFRHEREDHKGFSCSSCHTNILEATSLANLAAEVPLATCSGCHAGTRKDIQKEMDKVKADPKFNCAYCHGSNIGSRDIPASHFAVVGRTPVSRAPKGWMSNKISSEFNPLDD